MQDPLINYLQWHADTQAFLIENIILEMTITNSLFILMIDSPVKPYTEEPLFFADINASKNYVFLSRYEESLKLVRTLPLIFSYHSRNLVTNCVLC